MQNNCQVITKDIANRINRLEGQVSGIKKMIKEGKNCMLVVQQISAARAALSKLAVELLKEESRDCIEKQGKTDKQESFEDIVSNLFKIVN